MLSGMGVPDLLGTQGTFTIYTTDEVAPETTGGRQIQVKPVDGRIEAAFEGPPDPFWVEPTPMSVPVVIEQGDGGKVKVDFAGTPVELAAWRLERLGDRQVHLRRLHERARHGPAVPRRSFPNLKLYVSPIQIDPRAPGGADLLARRLFRRSRRPHRPVPHHRHARGDLGAQRGPDDRRRLARHGGHDPPRARGDVLRHAGQERQPADRPGLRPDRPHQPHVLARHRRAASAACPDQRAWQGCDPLDLWRGRPDSRQDDGGRWVPRTA